VEPPRLQAQAHQHSLNLGAARSSATRSVALDAATHARCSKCGATCARARHHNDRALGSVSGVTIVTTSVVAGVLSMVNSIWLTVPRSSLPKPHAMRGCDAPLPKSKILAGWGSCKTSTSAPQCRTAQRSNSGGHRADAPSRTATPLL
jgi:hypothetical protein